MIDNVIPFIGGEEGKSENEPLKIWGEVKDGEIVSAKSPSLTAQCLRVPAATAIWPRYLSALTGNHD
jgi:aspartate-semialdehyde dehydrogenase